MDQQNQAEQTLQACSQQLTHYLNDWLIQKSDRQLTKNRNIAAAANTAKRYQRYQRCQKQQMKLTPRQKPDVCRIQFPIIQHHKSQSLKDLKLPRILSRSKIYQITKEKDLSTKVINVCKTPIPTLSHQHKLELSIQKYQQNQIIKRLKRNRKNKSQYKNPQINNQKQILDTQILQMKALLARQLKNHRKSAHKELLHKQH